MTQKIIIAVLTALLVLACFYIQNQKGSDQDEIRRLQDEISNLSQEKETAVKHAEELLVKYHDAKHTIDDQIESLEIERKKRKQTIVQYEKFINGRILIASAVEASGTNRTLADSLLRARHLSNNSDRSH